MTPSPAVRGAVSAVEPFDRIVALLAGVTPHGSGRCSARCPAHDDRHASLSVTRGADGRVLLKCHAGCAAAAICTALGMGVKDLFPAVEPHKGNGHAGGNGHGAPRTLLATYDYRDAEGELVYQACRYHPKDFRQRRPDGRGGWIWNLEGVGRILYGLPELLNAREDRPDDWVFVVEGEKDVDALLSLDLVATTNVGGAGKWRDEYSEVLCGCRVALIADNDRPGQDHVAKVAEYLHGRAAEVRVVELPSLPPKGDVSDWLAAGGVAAQLLQLVDQAPPAEEPSPPGPVTFRELLRLYPALRPPVIHGLLRAGETMNVIAPPKTGKSWLVIDLALAVTAGRTWLDTYPTEAGNVLVLDNELHGETSASRIPKVAAARGVMTDQFADRLFVHNLRGHLKDLVSMGSYFDALEPGRFRLIVLDAFYRFLPPEADENDNATMAQLYNHLDRHAGRLGCCFVLIHHSTKGSQAGKAVTDVGAGAGSQSRATDTHLVLRQHEEDGVVVLDAAVRSWAPIRPVCLRWQFPLWTPDAGCDPAALRRPDGRAARPRKEDAADEAVGKTIPWTVERFVDAFVAADPRDRQRILDLATTRGELSERAAAKWLRMAEAEGKIHRWTPPNPAVPLRFATVQQPVSDTGKERS